VGCLLHSVQTLSAALLSYGPHPGANLAFRRQAEYDAAPSAPETAQATAEE
jgi:hypothetical protein